eukprot:TRINITY_DN11609_c0_g1_i5.p1 TRINITY_DN11609_c0_g1~~TRINITY_DN11609_c0_g1_i5.p1  ORF type:complete len:587 (+),score=143.47 TRINITY_DN11609_c0_g1_i5:48-1808(+)
MAELENAIKDTINTLGKVIKKPTLSEKYLKKPPFRFLHDIVTQVCKTSGFLEGLFNADERDVAKAGENKEAKIAFLQKAIDATSFAIGKSLAAHPKKIVSGHDPENTNVWLQAMAYAVKKKISSEAAVQKVLSGERPSKSKSKSKSSSSKSESKSKSESSKTKESSSKPKESSSKSKEGSSRTRDDKERKRSSKSSSRGERDKSGRSRSAKPEKEHSSRKSSRQDLNPPGPESEAPTSSTTAQPEPAAPAAAASNPEQAQPSEPTQQARPSEAAQPAAATEERPRSERPTSARPARSDQGDMQRPVSKYPAQQASELSGTEPAASAQPTDSQPEPEPQPLQPDPQALPGNVKKNVRLRERPSSARPAPPRVKAADNQLTESESRNASASVRSTAAAAGIIRAGDEAEDDEGDDFVVAESSSPQVASAGLPDELAHADDGNDDEQGALMRKIMAKKGEESSEPNQPLGDAFGLERQQAEKEVETLKKSVQTLCRCANPLGRVIDYIQEDVDSMRKELLEWRAEFQEHSATLADEARETDTMVEPLRAELADLEQQVRDKQDLISSLRLQTLEHDAKIQKLMSGMATG